MDEHCDDVARKRCREIKFDFSVQFCALKYKIKIKDLESGKMGKKKNKRDEMMTV